MTKKDVVKSILAFMEKEMGLYNFKPNFKQQGFIRKDEGAIFPYLFTSNTVKKIDELFNSHPQGYSVHMYFDPYRFVKGTIAAKLARNPGLDHLVTTYSNFNYRKGYDG
ncbi:hypothetical protein [Chitinophaga sp. 212800010-3]|uniref:hypothetical protein n=1 Tax=unclassified Chitinophaga TaxID=2619133 RepID=UPI002DE23AF4|nr:hypothetical protein [Chitinophaga sp. 212800010-3]